MINHGNDIKFPGRVIKQICVGKDKDGWPTTMIEFTDGMALLIRAMAYEQDVTGIDPDTADKIRADMEANAAKEAAEQAKWEAGMTELEALPPEERRARSEARRASFMAGLYDYVDALRKARR